MKFLLTVGLLTTVNAYATDFSTHCLKYLNGEMGQKPGIMEDFKAVEEEVMIKGVKQKTIIFQAVGENNFVSDVDTDFDRRKKEETQTIVMSSKNKKGKDVKDYTLVITRDEQGNIKEIKKNYALKDFRPMGDKLTFATYNGSCIPDEQHSGVKRDFNATLCYKLEKFFKENEEAEACLKAGHEKKLRNIIGAHQQIYKPFMNENLGNSLLLKSGKEIGKCYDSGLAPLLSDAKTWKGVGEAPVVVATPAEETEED